MFRSGIVLLQKPHAAHRWIGSTTGGLSQHLPAGLRSTRLSGSKFWIDLRRPHDCNVHRTYPLRALSTEKKEGGADDPKKEKTTGADDDETKEIVLTPGEKVVVASRLGMWAGIAAFAAVCAYYIGKELIPT